MKTYHIYAEIGPEPRIFRVALDSSLESAIETAQYLRQALPCVEVVSTDFDHVPDAQAARTLGQQEWYQYDGDTLSTSAAAILGSSKSEAKRAAARENGKKGGRPQVRYSYELNVGLICNAQTDPNRSHSFSEIHGVQGVANGLDALRKQTGMIANKEEGLLEKACSCGKTIVMGRYWKD